MAGNATTKQGVRNLHHRKPTKASPVRVEQWVTCAACGGHARVMTVAKWIVVPLGWLTNGKKMACGIACAEWLEGT